jgi:hypothetical protein
MRSFILLLTVLALTSCFRPTNVKKVEAESLLNSSSEDVSFDLVNDESVNSISTWINDDRPSEARLVCVAKAKLCVQAQQLFKKKLVPYKVVKPESGVQEAVKLSYERVSAKDCDSHILGCSVSVNTLQTVADHTTFIKPALSDPQDAVKAAKVYNRYLGN